MPWIIDGHQDFAYNTLANQRDYTQTVAVIRHAEPNNTENQATLGWDAYRNGQFGVIFGTIFLEPPNHREHAKTLGTSYDTAEEFHRSVLKQIDVYRELQEKHPDKFKLIQNKADLHALLEARQQPEPADAPIGIVILLEGAEALRSFDDLEEYYQSGMRLIGPVWEGGRWCGGTFSPNSQRLTAEGHQLLQRMADKGFCLDISHMNTLSANDALSQYDGTVVASHCNCRALLKNPPNERHLTDETIARLIERDGVMGVIPYNGFLKIDWKSGDPRSQVTLDDLANHIDHICQIAGDAAHAALGTDADGGFGYPNIPLEINDMGDLQKLERNLQHRGYNAADIAAIFHGNWLRMLERVLP